MFFITKLKRIPSYNVNCETYLYHNIKAFNVNGFAFNNIRNNTSIHRHPLCLFAIEVLQLQLPLLTILITK